jgi:hypothetical protein
MHIRQFPAAIEASNRVFQALFKFSGNVKDYFTRASSLDLMIESDTDADSNLDAVLTGWSKPLYAKSVEYSLDL